MTRADLAAAGCLRQFVACVLSAATETVEVDLEVDFSIVFLFQEYNDKKEKNKERKIMHLSCKKLTIVSVN